MKVQSKGHKEPKTDTVRRADSMGELSDLSIDNLPDQPDALYDPVKLFGVKLPFEVRGFRERCSQVPEVEAGYVFDPLVTKAIICSLVFNLRLLVHGYHGTGKSTHIEQVAARLNWPCVRVNLDGHVSRMDLIGKDSIRVRDGFQVTEFIDGIVPWCITRPVILCLDEYDAGRADVMFVLQRLLEARGKLTLLDQSRVIAPHASSRIVATANTIGQGDSAGIYHGTQPLNQGQLDRWSVVVRMNFPTPRVEEEILIQRAPELNTNEGRALIKSMIAFAQLTRHGFQSGNISTLMTPRTLITWTQNLSIFGNIDEAFIVSYFNRCDETEHPILAEYYQRCFNRKPFDVDMSPDLSVQ